MHIVGHPARIGASSATLWPEHGDIIAGLVNIAPTRLCEPNTIGASSVAVQMREKRATYRARPSAKSSRALPVFTSDGLRNVLYGAPASSAVSAHTKA